MLNFVRIKIWDNLPQNSKIFFFSLNFPLIYFAKKCDILGSVSFTNIDAVSQGKPVIYGIATWLHEYYGKCNFLWKMELQIYAAFNTGCPTKHDSAKFDMNGHKLWFYNPSF